MTDSTPTESELLSEHLSDFTKLGFTITKTDATHFSVFAIPDIFKKRDIIPLILETLDNMHEGTLEITPDHASDETIAYLACRTAIKAGDPLTQEERRELVKKLQTSQESNAAYTCPHGRPVQIEVSLDELARMFRRK